MKRKVLSLALALVMGLALAAPASAYGDFTVTDGMLVSYNGPGGDVVIPSGVAAIDKSVFRGNADITSVTLPYGVTDIGEFAFSECAGLTGVTLPDSLTRIGFGAFEDCAGLTGVTIPESVTEIGDYAFFRCSSLTGVALPGGLTQIGESAFAGCESLAAVTIPEGVSSIDSNAFSGCVSLAEVTLPESLVYLGEGAFSDCAGLTGVTIPDNVSTIGFGAFSGCTELTGATIGNGVTELVDVFYDCPNLTSVTIPAGVAEIDMEAYGQPATIQGADGSYAQVWAMENGFPFVAALPGAATPGKTAYASTQSIWVDGTPVTFQAYALRDEKGNDTNYIKLRDVASVLNGSAAQFQVGWENGRVTLTTGTPYTALGTEMTTPYAGDRTYARVGSEYVRLNGAFQDMSSLLLKDAGGNGYTYFKLRDLGAALGFNVSWDGATGISIDSTSPYDPAN